MEKMRGKDCPVCGRERFYKTKQGMKKGEGILCKSCANSIKRGGSGWSSLCFDCGANPKEDKYSSLCQTCHNNRSKMYHKDVYRFARYGVTKEEVTNRFTGKCEICESDIDFNSCHLDHCHDTNKFRGILCELCNKGLGQFKDNIKAIERAANYLRRFNEHDK